MAGRHATPTPIASGFLVLLALASAISPAQAQHNHAHQHGVAKLYVGIDAQQISLELESPMENLVGFERAPRNDREREALRVMEKQLADTATLFAPNADAACRPASVKISIPRFDNTQGKGSGHVDVEVSYILRCDNIGGLRELEVRFFDTFKRLRRIEASVAGRQKQSGATLTPDRRKLPL